MKCSMMYKYDTYYNCTTHICVCDSVFVYLFLPGGVSLRYHYLHCHLVDDIVSIEEEVVFEFLTQAKHANFLSLDISCGSS